jgi:hypothetical protein
LQTGRLPEDRLEEDWLAEGRSEYRHVDQGRLEDDRSKQGRLEEDHLEEDWLEVGRSDWGHLDQWRTEAGRGGSRARVQLLRLPFPAREL